MRKQIFISINRISGIELFGLILESDLKDGICKQDFW